MLHNIKGTLIEIFWSDLTFKQQSSRIYRSAGTPVHKGAFCKFSFRWIYYYVSNKSTGKETGKTHLCAVLLLSNLVYLEVALECLQSGKSGNFVA